MKAVEVLSIFAAIFLVNLSLGNGAPQWRPQGRFGKRYSVRTNDLMTALTSDTEDSAELEPLFMQDPDLQNSVDYFTGRTLQKNLGARVCIETNFPGVFRCHRSKVPSDTRLSVDNE